MWTSDRPPTPALQPQEPDPAEPILCCEMWLNPNTVPLPPFRVRLLMQCVEQGRRRLAHCVRQVSDHVTTASAVCKTPRTLSEAPTPSPAEGTSDLIQPCRRSTLVP